MPAIAAWDAADRAARPMADPSNSAGAFALRAAYESTTLVNARHHQSTLDTATAFAARAHARAAGTGPSRTVELTSQAIRSWRHLAGLDNSANDATSANNRRNVASQPEFVLTR
jgi:hypothetical protein